MADLVEELVNEHSLLKGLLSEVYSYISSDEKKLEFVNKLKEIVVAHIGKEDKELYPFLNDEAENDTALKLKLASFAKDWAEISAFANNYFEKYCKGNFSAQYTTDTAKLISTLRQRMIKEEVSLFSEYAKRH